MLERGGACKGHGRIVERGLDVLTETDDPGAFLSGRPL